MRRRIQVMAARHGQQITVPVHELNSRAEHALVRKTLQQVPLKIAFGVRSSRVSDVALRLPDGTDGRQSEHQRLDYTKSQHPGDIVVDSKNSLGTIAFIAAEQ